MERILTKIEILIFVGPKDRESQLNSVVLMMCYFTKRRNMIGERAMAPSKVVKNGHQNYCSQFNLHYAIGTCLDEEININHHIMSMHMWEYNDHCYDIMSKTI